MSPAPHLDALDLPSYPMKLTRRPHPPVSRPSHGLEEETRSYLSSGGVPGSYQTGAELPASLSVLLQPVASEVSRTSTPVSLTSCRPVPLLGPQQGICGQDR